LSTFVVRHGYPTAFAAIVARAAAYIPDAGIFLAGVPLMAIVIYAARKVHWHRWSDEL
jgi:hypothetical protein